MNEETGRPPLDTDPKLPPDEGEISRLAAVVEEDDAGTPITVIDRGDRLSVDHNMAPAQGSEDSNG